VLDVERAIDIQAQRVSGVNGRASRPCRYVEQSRACPFKCSEFYFVAGALFTSWTADKVQIGAIGVSGGTADQDEACAHASIDAAQNDLK
jgi:hypothetical protein